MLALLSLAWIGCTAPIADTVADPANTDSGNSSDACDLDPPGDLEPGELADCAECVDEKCVDLFPYCDEDPDCSCMVECLRQRGVGGVESCLD